ncbi:MAG: hypothetical protein ACJAWS_001355 [Oleiphilaceae bacterium]|jgi:hypothetical protein
MIIKIRLNAFNQKPTGSIYNEVDTPKPIIAKPTTQVGVGQQITPNIVSEVIPKNRPSISTNDVL